MMGMEDSRYSNTSDKDRYIDILIYELENFVIGEEPISKEIGDRLEEILEKRKEKMRRERVEDLGELRVMIKKALNMEIFTKFEDIGAVNFKYAEESFNKLADEYKGDFIRRVAFQIQELQELLYACLQVAKGTEDDDER